MSAPYYQDEHVTLYHGDYAETLATLNITADLIVTDPPYGETSLAWDVWPSGWPAKVAQLTHAPAMWCFGSMRMFMDQATEFAGWKLSQDIVWEKHTGTGFTTDRFKRVHEHALHWYRGEWRTVHHETPKVPAEHGDKGRVVRRAHVAHTGRIGNDVPYVDDGTRLQRSVIKVRNMHGDAIHPTEKPVPILEPLIAYGCPPGGLVVDPFAGSGSTGVAARNLGMKAILIEGREKQCEATARRLAQGVFDFASLIQADRESA